jgi:hypothetical protein
MRVSNAAINTTDNSLGIDWSAGWDTPAATELFAFVREEVCGLLPIMAGLTADVVVTEALAEVHAILAEAGEDGPHGSRDHDGDCGDDPGDQGEGDADAWAGESWVRAAEDYGIARGARLSIVEIEPENLTRPRELLANEISLPRAYAEIATRHTKGRAADSTVEVAMFSLRGRGVAALEEPDIRRRISELDDDQALEIAARLQRLKPEIARAWSAVEVETLLQLREMLR